MNNKKSNTAYAVYIIESLRVDDFHDGKILHNILELIGITSIYEKPKTVKEFEYFINDFKRSQFRYLHISCHADRLGLEINGEEYSNEALGHLFKEGGLQNKRVFMSACEGANRDLASKLIFNCGAYSIIGTPIGLDFDKSALFWPSFYRIVHKNDKRKMKRAELIKSLQKCVDFFKVPINYYSKINSSFSIMRRVKIRTDRKVENLRIPIG